MKTFFFSALLLSFIITQQLRSMPQPLHQDADSTYTLLSLGDSYTIGESVPEVENFPHQLVTMLRAEGVRFQAPDIVAKTGWTTDELQDGISRASLRAGYDLVTLLIGVNNQYRGRPLGEYRHQFEDLLKQALVFAGNQPTHVIVLSIPDWGVTPFAADRDREAIGRDIDAFNAANRAISTSYGVQYLDITGLTREAASEPGLVAADGLHPSGREYARWSAKLVPLVTANFQGTGSDSRKTGK